MDIVNGDYAKLSMNTIRIHKNVRRSYYGTGM